MCRFSQEIGPDRRARIAASCWSRSLRSQERTRWESFARGARLWARYKNEKGEWINERTGFAVGQEDKAQRYLARIVSLARDARDSTRSHPSASAASITVKDYVERWLEDRRALSLASWGDDANRLRKHVVPFVGKLHLAAVRPSDVRDVVLYHRKANKLAPRTIRHVFATMAIMFGDAMADELITTTPCVLRKGVLPKKVDKDPEWRATAIYDRDGKDQVA